MCNLRMRMLIFVSLFIGLASCGGGGGGDGGSTPTPTPAALPWSPGLYTVDLTPTGGETERATILVTSDDRVFYGVNDGSHAKVGTTSGNIVELDNVAGPNDLSTLTLSSAGATAGTFALSFNVGDESGTFVVVDDADNDKLYNSSSTLASLAGTWVDDTFTDLAGVSTWVIQADGSYTVNTETGGSGVCSATGNISLIDATKNEYASVSTLVNCGAPEGLDPSLNGEYKGVFFVTENFLPGDTRDMLFGAGSISLSNGTIQTIFSVPVRQ